MSDIKLETNTTFSRILIMVRIRRRVNVTIREFDGLMTKNRNPAVAILKPPEVTGIPFLDKIDEKTLCGHSGTHRIHKIGFSFVHNAID